MKLLSKILVFIIRLYRILFSPVIGKVCRFEPSCSQYTEQAVIKHGPIKGILLGIKRIIRCSPFTKGGYDPVP